MLSLLHHKVWKVVFCTLHGFSKYLGNMAYTHEIGNFGNFMLKIGKKMHDNNNAMS